ncbi:MAG TPA: hypothetical protein VK537_08500 [Galbitalea sp.]|nr:hypothetical protein [Galbitalea sp.]
MGQFAQLQDAIDQFEGVIPSSRQAWVTNLIPRVEARLIGLVPSLATLSQTADPARFTRAKFLVTEKVLEIYRNPTGTTTDSVMGQSVTYSRTISSGRISFTDEELATVRQRTKRANLGTAMVHPWHPRGRRGVLRGPW